MVSPGQILGGAAGPKQGVPASQPLPHPPANRAGTYKAAKHGAGDTGGQAHGRGRSGPEHMSREPLRCPLVPGARRIPAAGPARCSRGGLEASAPTAQPHQDSRAPLPSFPLLSTMEQAQLRPPAGAQGREAGRAARRCQCRQSLGRRGPGGGRGGAWDGSTGLRPQAPDSSSLRVPGGVGGQPTEPPGPFRAVDCGATTEQHDRGKPCHQHFLTSHALR